MTDLQTKAAEVLLQQIWNLIEGEWGAEEADSVKEFWSKLIRDVEEETTRDARGLMAADRR